MKYEITSRNYEVGDKLKEITKQKLDKLDKYFGGQEATAKVTFKKEATSFTTEVMLEFANKLVRASASSDNFYTNIDVVVPKLEGQIRKHRTKFDQHQKNSAYKEAVVYAEAKALEEKTANVVKQKQFKLKPLTVDEAIAEMELLGHNFYVFLEAKSNTIQVLYLRNDGDLGLIEPKI